LRGQEHIGGRIARPVTGWYPLAVILTQVEGEHHLEFWFSLVDERLGRTALVTPSLGVPDQRLRQVVRGIARNMLCEMLRVPSNYLQDTQDEASLTITLRVLPGVTQSPLTLERVKETLDQATDAINVALLQLGAGLPVMAADIHDALERTKTDSAFVFDVTRHLGAIDQVYFPSRDRAFVTASVPEGSNRAFALAYSSKEVGMKALAGRGGADYLGGMEPGKALALVLAQSLAGMMLDWVPGDAAGLLVDRSQIAIAFIAAKLQEWRSIDTWWVLGEPPFGLVIPYAPSRKAICGFTTADAASTYASTVAEREGTTCGSVREVSRDCLGEMCLNSLCGALVVNAGTRTSVAVEGANLADLWRQPLNRYSEH
jgi:hypothetical protein